MKAVKFLTVMCAVVVFLCGLTAENTFAQASDAKETVISKQTKEAQYVPDEKSDDNVPANRQSNEKYRIGFQDTLEITVLRHPELSLTVNVSPNGTILMPRIDKPIVAVCKTENELKANLETLYRTYLKNPFVNVRTVDQRSQPFAVIGAVEKPGSFNLNRKVRLLEALAFAGGPKVEKAGANVQVARVGNLFGCVDKQAENEEVAFVSYKIKDVMEGKENPWMQPGDIVSVLEVEQAFVVGNVKEPTKVPLKEPVTLTQAIAFAGGLAPEAKTNNVKIQRQQSGSTLKVETVYNLKDITSKKIPDPVLQANDIVEVPKDGVKSARNGILKALTNGIPGLFYGL